MLAQLARLQRCLEGQGGWSDLCAMFPELYDLSTLGLLGPAIDRSTMRTEVMDLYRRYIQEWHRFPVDGLGAFLRPGSSEQTH